MKKFFTKAALFLAAILPAGSVWAQSGEHLIDDFESGNKGWAVVSCYYDIRDNVYKGGIGTGEKVLFTNRGTGNDNWSGAILAAANLQGSPITGYRYLHAKMYRNNTNNPNLKVTDSGSGNDLLPMSGITIVANQWQDVVFDLGSRSVDYVMFMVDRSAPLAAEAWMLIDDIILSNDPTPRTGDVPIEPLVIGSIKGAGVPLYPIRDGAAPGTAVAATFDFKVASIGSKSWVWTELHGMTISNNSWSSQFRYWPGKIENNLTGRVTGTQQTFGIASKDLPNNPVTITFLQEQNNVFFETADFTYDITKANSKDAGDATAPVLAEPTVVSQTGTQLKLSLSATDNADFFYYIEDAANNLAEVSFSNDATLALVSGVNYSLSIYAIDFSGNRSEAKTVKVQTGEQTMFTEGTAKAISFKLDSRSLTELAIECTSNDFIGDAFVKMEINGVSLAPKEWKATINQATGTKTYRITVPAGDVPGWAKDAVLALNLGYIVMPIGNWGHYVTENSVITEGPNTGLPILHKIGTGVDIEPPKPPVTYICNGNDILAALTLTSEGPYFAPGWNPTENYTKSWENGKFTLHLTPATGEAWQAQFPLRTAVPQTLEAGKTYFLSYDIEASKNLPRVYVKVQKYQGSNDNFLELPTTNISAGVKKTVSGIFTNEGATTIAQFDEILFDFGGNPADVDIVISNLTICDGYAEQGEAPDGPTAPGTPTHNPANVVSVYCAAYNNIADINYNPNWSQPTQVNPNYAVGSAKLLEYKNLTYQGTEFTDQNVTDMTHIHIEVWTSTAFTPNLSLINHDPQIEKPYPMPLTAKQWNSFDIPLSAFDMPQYAIWQFKVDNGGGNTMYIANWYFYNEAGVDSEAPTNFTATKGTVTKEAVQLVLKADDNSGAVFYTISYGDPVQTKTVGGKSGVQRNYMVTGLEDDTNYTFTVTAKDRAGNVSPTTHTITATTEVDILTKPKVAAPAPTVPEGNVLSVRSATYGNYQYNIGSWSQTTTTSIVKVAGIETLKLENFNYLGLEFVGAGGSLDISDMNYMHIDVWTPNGISFEVGLADPTFNFTPLVKEEWNSFDIPLTSFPNNLEDIQVMKLVGSSSGPGTCTFYIDNLYFYKGGVGIGKKLADKLNVYSANGKLCVSGSNEPVAVYNALGKAVYKNASAENVMLDLPQGLYIVKVGANAAKIMVK